PALGLHPGRIDAPGGAAGAIAVGTVGARTVACAGHPQGTRQRHGLDRVGKMIGDGRTAPARGAVRRPTGVVHHVGAGVLVARSVGLEHVPVEQREDLVEARIALEVGVVEVRVAAVAESVVGDDQRQARLAVITHAVFVAIEERRGGEIRVPLLLGETTTAAVLVKVPTRPVQGYRGGQAVDDLVVPLIEYRDAPVAVRNAVQHEVAIGVALCKCKVLAVRVPEARVALSEAQRRVVLAAVKTLIGRAALTLHGHGALHRVLAVIGVGRLGSCALRCEPRVDDRRIGKADHDVEARRTELLEVRRTADFDERVVGLLSIQSVGLQPFLAAPDAVRARRGLDSVAPRHEVRDHRLSRERRKRAAVGLVLRARDDHADQSVGGTRRDRTRIAVGGRIDGSGQAVRQRHVEHVVGHLAGGIAGATRVIEQADLEATQARLVGGEDVDAAAGGVLAVERHVVLEYKYRNLGALQGRLLQQYVHAALPGIYRGATHGVAAGAAARGKVRATRPGRAVERDTELTGGIACLHRRAGASRERVACITRQNGDVVVLGGIEVHLARIHRVLLRGAGAADTVADVAHRGVAEQRLTGFAGIHADAAGRHYRHVAGMEVGAETRGGLAGIGLRRIDMERAILLDDPAIVVDGHRGRTGLHARG